MRVGVGWLTKWDKDNLPERTKKSGKEGKADSLREFPSLTPHPSLGHGSTGLGEAYYSHVSAAPFPLPS